MSCYDFNSDSSDGEPMAAFCPVNRRARPLNLEKDNVAEKVVNEVTLVAQQPVATRDTRGGNNEKTLNLKRKFKGKENWTKAKAKRLRGHGEEYVSPNTKKKVPKREIKPVDPANPCCKGKRCFENIPRNVQKFIKEQYYSLGGTIARRSYIQNMVLETKPKRHYGNNPAKQKQVTRTYRFKWNTEVSIDGVS